MKAILVGVNNYLHYPEDQLNGCIPDANHVWALLNHKLAWPERELQLLKDAQAAAAQEKAAVLAMIAAAGPGDHLVWSHSSHGSNNPAPREEQQDGLEELLCSYDIREQNGRWDEGTVITAKWIGQAILKLHPQASLDIILDCCNAPEGGQLKLMGLSYSRARFMRRSLIGTPVSPAAGQLRVGSVPPNVALWCACESAQTSADAYVDGGFQGAFTAAFLKSWKAGHSRAEIIFAARDWLAKNRYAQRPHLYCGPVMAAKPFGN